MDYVPPVAADLALDTAVTPVPEVPGAFTATLTPAWNWHLPAGGVLMTVGLRAIEAAIGDPSLQPVSATTLFCAPVPPGPVAIRVDLLRRGNATVQARASVRSLASQGTSGAPPGEGSAQRGLAASSLEPCGAPDFEVSATFARAREAFGIDVLDAAPPVVPSPAEAPPYLEPRRGGAGFPFLANFESKLALGKPFWRLGWEPGPARFARWMRYLVPQRRPDGTVDPLALPPIADLMPTALTQKLGPEGPRFMAPSLDLTVHFLDPSTSDWLLISTWVRRARAGYATGEVEIWGDDGRLLAYGNQTMMLRKPTPPTPPTP
ncbi:acyl-CoA thioesterase [Chondromyces crocatus]|uniref:Acyl-CoA thioesterase-like protein n=1 Tax=Chondromyces crocatus TaxID=52 RepID=A0A0K1EM53_CHOCO|nr:thioesterase family protein [Chondromyces crocatus]AKT41727.1 acyl-CoA thioesterase-like protein [Chondromyces crocatus]